MSGLEFNSNLEYNRYLKSKAISSEEQNKKSQEQQETQETETINNSIYCTENDEGSMDFLTGVGNLNYSVLSANSNFAVNSSNIKIKNMTVAEFYSILDKNRDGEIVAEDVINTFNNTNNTNLKAILSYFTDGKIITPAFKIACAGVMYDSYETWNKGISRYSDDTDMIAKNGIISKDSLERLKKLAENPSTKTVLNHLGDNRAESSKAGTTNTANSIKKTAKNVVIKDYSNIAIEDFYALLDSDGDGEIVAEDVINAYNNTTNEEFKALLSFLTDGNNITKAFKIACAGISYDSYETWNKGITNHTDDPDMIAQNGFVTKESLARLAELAENPSTEAVLAHLKLNRSNNPEKQAEPQFEKIEPEPNPETASVQSETNETDDTPNMPSTPAADTAAPANNNENNAINDSEPINGGGENNQITSASQTPDVSGTPIANDIEEISINTPVSSVVNAEPLTKEENNKILHDTLEEISNINFANNTFENDENYQIANYSGIWTDDNETYKGIMNNAMYWLSRINNPEGRVYDENNRLTQIKDDFDDIEFIYNQNGQLTNIKAAGDAYSTDSVYLTILRNRDGAITSLTLTDNPDFADYLSRNSSNTLAGVQDCPAGFLAQVTIGSNNEITEVQYNFKKDEYSASRVSESNPTGFEESRSISYTLDKDMNYTSYNAKTYREEKVYTEWSLDGNILTKHIEQNSVHYYTDTPATYKYAVDGKFYYKYYEDETDSYISLTKLLSETQGYSDTYGYSHTSKWMVIDGKLYYGFVEKKDKDENGQERIVTQIATGLPVEEFVDKGYSNNESYFLIPYDYLVEYPGNVMEKMLPGMQYISYTENSELGNKLKNLFENVSILSSAEYNAQLNEIVNSKEFRIAYIDKLLEDNMYEAQLISELQGTEYSLTSLVELINGATDTLDNLKNINEKNYNILKQLSNLVNDTDAFNDYYKKSFGKEFSMDNFDAVGNILSQSQSLSLLAEAEGITTEALKGTAKTAAALALGIGTGLAGASVLTSIGAQGILSSGLSLWESALDGNISDEEIYQAAEAGAKTMLYNTLGLASNAAGEVVAQKLMALGTPVIASKILGFGAEVLSDTAISYATASILGDDTTLTDEFVQSFTGNLIGGLTGKLTKDVKAIKEEVTPIKNTFTNAGANDIKIKNNLDGTYKLSFEYNGKQIEIDKFNYTTADKFDLLAQIAAKPDQTEAKIKVLDRITSDKSLSANEYINNRLADILSTVETNEQANAKLYFLDNLKENYQKLSSQPGYAESLSNALANVKTISDADIKLHNLDTNLKSADSNYIGWLFVDNTGKTGYNIRLQQGTRQKISVNDSVRIADKVDIDFADFATKFANMKDGDSFIIGRQATGENDITINNASVSRQHLKVEKIDGEIYITDLSTNGTILNTTMADYVAQYSPSLQQDFANADINDFTKMIKDNYKNLRRADYSLENSVRGNITDADLRTNTDNAVIQDSGYWLFRYPTSQYGKTVDRISLNVVADKNLLTELDKLCATGEYVDADGKTVKVENMPNCKYKTPPSLKEFTTRHDPITMYFDNEVPADVLNAIAYIAGKYARPSSNGKALMNALEDKPYISHEAYVAPDKAKALYNEAQKLNSELANAIYKELNNKNTWDCSTGQFAACQKLVDEYKLNYTPYQLAG